MSSYLFTFCGKDKVHKLQGVSKKKNIRGRARKLVKKKRRPPKLILAFAMYIGSKMHVYRFI